MFSFIISIVMLVLFLFDIISSVTGSFVVGSALALDFIGSYLYSKFGFLRIYYHDLLGWHQPSDSSRYFDGCSEHNTCKYCGKDIMQDSQGNWF
jgi:hypothetical protein